MLDRIKPLQLPQLLIRTPMSQNTTTMIMVIRESNDGSLLNANYEAVTDLPPQLVFARGSSSQQYSQGNAHAQPAVTQSFFQKVACTFDPLWCVKEGFDIDALEWTTKLKFDALFIHGALHIDDSLIMDAMYENQGAEIPTQICFQVISEACAAVIIKQLTGLAVLRHGTTQSTELPDQDITRLS